ncbi:MAG: hypothetical protein ACK5HS_02515 [Mycoplasmatales bacterium]
MVSKESLILIAVLIMLVMSFMYWAKEQSKTIEDTIESQISETIDV